MQVLIRMVLCALLLFGAAMAGAQEAAPRPLSSAMAALRSGDWGRARALALRDGQVAADIIEWHRLRAGRGAANEVGAFLARNPDWPGLRLLRRRSETAMAQASDADIRAFFSETAPQTATGAMALARVQRKAGEAGAADAGLVLAWRTMRMSASEQADMLAAHDKLLSPHHAARLDFLLWQGWDDEINRMLPLVDEGRRKLAEARRGLRRLAGNVDTLIAEVPPALAEDPGLAHARFEWRMRKGRTDDAVELLLARSALPGGLGEPEAWANRRRALAREEMRRGDTKLAYRLASQHQLAEGASFADLEWLSGYLALRHLDRPDLAATHFSRFTAAVKTPISLGRAGYWLGRALQAAGDEAAAMSAWREGARYQTSFYGLLAAEAAGLPPDPALAGQADLPDWAEAEFMTSTVLDAAILFLAAGEIHLSERFFTHLAESLPPPEIARLGQLLHDLGQPHLQVMVGKRAARQGVEVPAPYYALHPMTDTPRLMPPELLLAIARRESEFDHRVISGAGARGLMQIMPATAQAVAGELGMEFDAGRLLDDWAYNATLGDAYLRDLSRDFNGNAVMMAAAYNAGPSRPRRWMELYGDPRKGEIDVIDWIEMIPFRETRNYVMRVTESLPVYRARLGRNPLPVPFSKELAGSSLLPLSPEGE